ncbi:hypothetical protein NQZ68_034276, partial [Dissostichus eleginoides]
NPFVSQGARACWILPPGKTGIQQQNKWMGAPSDGLVDSWGQPPPVVTDSQSHTCPTTLKPSQNCNIQRQWAGDGNSDSSFTQWRVSL